MTSLNYKQKGEVSLFVVIFATLLMTIVTVSFVRIMIQGQQQSSTIDLSQSAYDSALAGVEDAKRAILRYTKACGIDPASAACATATAQLNSTECNAAIDGLVDIGTAKSPTEVKVQNSSTNNNLDQAYTCVKVTLNTVDVGGELTKGSSKFIPLLGVAPFSSVQIKWFQTSDYNYYILGEPSLLAFSVGTPLRPASAVGWPANRPPVIRAQLIQFGDGGGGFNLDDFNSSGGSNALFLYPSLGGLNDFSFASDSRVTPTNTPYQVKCLDNLAAGGYACTARITLPGPVNGGNSTSFLNLSSAYSTTSYQIMLLDNTGNSVLFKTVQPKIDSTGRANSLFRRVRASAEMSSEFPYPLAALNTPGNLCKDFSVTDDPAQFNTLNTVSGLSINGCAP